MTLIFNIFLLLSLGLIISSSFVVFSFNPVYSLLWLVLAFLFSASLLLVFGSEFLAFIFIIVYVGAITVLFLFSVMLLDFKIKNFNKKRNKSFFSLFLLSTFFILIFIILNKINNSYSIYKFQINFNSNNFLFLFLIDKSFLVFFNWSNIYNSLNEVEVYSLLMYDIFILEFLLIGFILLAVLIGIIRLTNMYKNEKSSEQSVFKQIAINSNFFINK